MTMSVMLICTSSAIGGMERLTCSLARGLTDEGLRVRTFFPDSGSSGELVRWAREQGVEVETHPDVLDGAADHSWRSARRLTRLVREVDPDVIGVHYGDNFLSMWDAVGVRLAGWRRPFLVTIPHPTAWADTSTRKRVMTTIGTRLTNAVVTIAEATRVILRQAGVLNGRLHVIRCGVRAPASLVDPAAARRALGLGDGAFVVGALGRLVPHKGIDELIDAMDDDALRPAVLLVGGDGPHRAALEERAVRQGVDARFLGYVPDEGTLFAASDVFALPSRLEGFGLVYVEAAMYGVPSVAARVGGVPDAVVDGETGVLITAGDVDGLRRALVELRTDPALRARLGAAARHRAMTELTESAMARRYAELYRTLVRRG